MEKLRYWPVSLLPPQMRGTVYLGLLAAAALPVLLWPPTSNTLPFMLGALGAPLAVYLSLHRTAASPHLWAPVMLVISLLASVLLGVDWAIAGEPAGSFSSVMALAALAWLVQLMRTVQA